MKATIDQEYYDSLIDEINLLQELLAEANNRIVELEEQSKDCTPKFKQVKDMTIRDWELAILENHKFKLSNGTIVRVISVDEYSEWCVGTEIGWHKVDGSFDTNHKEHEEDIIERVS